MYIKIGKNFSKNILINEKILRKYISFSGDTNPIHTNKLTAKNYGFKGIVIHGGIIVALISKIIGTKIPGPGSLCLEQNIKYLKPVYVGDIISLQVRIINYFKSIDTLLLKINIYIKKVKVIEGSMKVLVGEKILKKNKNTINKIKEIFEKK